MNQRGLPGATHDRNRPRTGAWGSAAALSLVCRRPTRAGRVRRTAFFFGAGSLSTGARITSPPGRSMTDSQALQAEQLAGDVSPLHRRPPHTDGTGMVRPHAEPAVLAFGAPACGAFAPGRRRPQAGLPVALRSAPQTVRLQDATHAPGRRRTRRASREEAAVTPRAQSRVLSRGLHPSAWSLCRGASPPPDPPPPCGRGSARSTPVRGHARHGHPAAPLALARRAPGVAPQRGRPERAWLQHHPGAPARHSRAPPPAWGAVVLPAAAPWLASRSLLAPAAAGRRGPPRRRDGRCRGPRLARRAGAARPAPRPVPVLRAVRSAGSGTSAGASARAPLAGDGLNPARFAPRRCAAGCAGGLTPPPARGSG